MMEKKRKKAKKAAEGKELKIDRYENENEIVLLAELAGAEISDIKITTKNEVLTIKGSKRTGLPVAKYRKVSQECSFGDFERDMVLPEEADTDNIEATFENNVLKIKIGKKEEKSKPIKIKIE